MPSTIPSYAEFAARLADARRRVDQLAAKDPAPMIQSIRRQLAFVDRWTQGGRRPAQDDLDKLTFGQMASRAVHEVDADLANELYELSSYLIFWPPTEPVRV